MTLPVTKIEDFERVPKSLILRMNDITRYQNRRFRTGSQVIETRGVGYTFVLYKDYLIMPILKRKRDISHSF